MKEKIGNIFNLSWHLAKVNFKLRNEGSYLGIFWYLLDPLLMFLVLYAVFSQNIGLQINHYPLYLLAGLIIFNFFSSVTSESASIISSNSHFIKSINIPAESLIFSLLFRNIFSHLFEIIIFCLFLAYFKLSVLGIIFYLPLFLLLFLFTAGISFILATLGVYANDLNNVWRFILQVLFFSSAIFYQYDPSITILKYNPLAIFINLNRQAFISLQKPEISWLFLILVSSVFLIGYAIFTKNKQKFAERI